MPEFNLGEVTSKEAGESPTATMVLTEKGYNLNFAIPKGEKGPKGDEGDPFRVWDKQDTIIMEGNSNNLNTIIQEVENNLNA